MKWSWTLPTSTTLEGYRYVAMRYRAVGVSPRGHYALCFLGTTISKSNDYEVALAPVELIADGRWHLTWANLDKLAAKFTTLTALACEAQAHDPKAELDLGEIRLTTELPTSTLSDWCAWHRDADFAGFKSILLTRPDADVSAWLRKLHITDWPDTNRLTIEGIPFALAPDKLKFAATPLQDLATLRLPVGLKAAEVCLFLLAEFQGLDEPVYGQGRFQAIHDLDRFRVRLEYADGTADECLPLNAASHDYGVTEGVQVLVAAADPSKVLAEIVLRDLTTQAAFAVAAITARIDGKRSFPEALEETPPLAHKPHGDQPGIASSTPKFELSGSTLRIASGACEALIDLGSQPSLRQLQERAAGWALLSSASALVQLTVDGRLLSPDEFKLSGISSETGGPGRSNRCTAEYRLRGFEGLVLLLALGPDDGGGLAMTASLTNGGAHSRRVALIAPRVGPYRLSSDAAAAYYLFPKRGAAFDNRSGTWRERYSGLFPLQFVDTFSPAESRGLTLRTEDTHCAWKQYVLEKNGPEFVVAVEYAEQVLQPAERFQTPPASICLTDGSWRRGFEAYRDWVRTWYQPLSPPKPWFREVFNFRQRFLHGLDPLYDGKHIDLVRALDEARREFGGIDYLHLFDWGNCGAYGRVYGRVGDYSPFDYLQGGEAALRQAIAGVQAQGTPVGLYIEGYLLDERGKLGQTFGRQWQLIDASGKGARWPDSTELYVCSYVPQWRQVQAATYAEKVKQLNTDGMYIDEFGFAGPNVDCWSAQHGHPRPGYAVLGERDNTRQIRQSIDGAKPGVAIYTEESPTDVVAQFQDGSFTYAMSTAHETAKRVPLNLVRFALPSFKTIEILICDKPTGSWATGVKWVFFNGEGLWLEGPATEWFGPQTREAIRKCHRLLRAHRDAFTTDRPAPLVPTLKGGIFANAFPTAGKAVYTLYNLRHRTVRGEVLEIPWDDGMNCEDAWLDRPAAVRRVGNRAFVGTELGPEDVGCIVVRKK